LTLLIPSPLDIRVDYRFPRAPSNRNMASNTSTPRIAELAKTIGDSVAKLQEVLKAQNAPFPSFDENAPASLPLEASEARDAVLDATTELHDLLLDPMVLIHTHGGHNNSLCQQAIVRFDIASKVPAGGEVSFAEIAKQTPLTEQMVARLLRHAMTMRIFREPRQGYVAHTKASKILADPILRDWLRVGTEEMWPAATKVVEALEKYPGSQEPNETGFCVANNTTDSIYAVLGGNPERAQRFGCAMMAYGMKPEHSPSFITNHYDWAALGKAKVVHAGGNQGHFAIALASKFSNLDLVVQDMAQMLGNEAALPEELKGRITFEAHELFAPQTVKADAVYFRWTLRNWADKYALMALKAQVPGLKAGGKIIIEDVILPEPGKPPFWKHKGARANDLSLAASFNSRDRTVADWKALLHEADPAFVFKGVTEPKGAALGILEFVYQG